jgi:CheY-like chemotaxis protein
MLSHLAQVDLLLLDVYMHQESGLDLLPALRADGRLKRFNQVINHAIAQCRLDGERIGSGRHHDDVNILAQ